MSRKNYYVKSRRTGGSVWAKRLLIALIAAAGVAVLVKFIVGEMGVVKYYRMSAHARSLRADIERLQKDNARLARDVDALRGDPAYLERQARDRLGLARPGEVVYYYGDATR